MDGFKTLEVIEAGIVSKDNNGHKFWPKVEVHDYSIEEHIIYYGRISFSFNGDMCLFNKEGEQRYHIIKGYASHLEGFGTDGKEILVSEKQETEPDVYTTNSKKEVFVKLSDSSGLKHLTENTDIFKGQYLAVEI